uniref:Proteasome 26S subunit, ATPase 6 n=1 Tax=Oryzias sinensis TaxID=183150 RepID=A0A8C8DRV8_9TELE
MLRVLMAKSAKDTNAANAKTEFLEFNVPMLPENTQESLIDHITELAVEFGSHTVCLHLLPAESEPWWIFCSWQVIELPLTNPELFQRVGIIPPKGCLLYGPPGTGKTLLARAVASQLDCNFLKVVSSSIVDKYIGESARLIREMFNYARDHQPCIIFMDEIDAIGGRRFSEGTSADREIQRTLMELLNQMDGFDTLHRVKMIMATNRPDTLDPALLRPGRLDRKIHIELPNEQARLDILKIHSSPITKHGEIDYEAIVKLSDGFNGADLRNVCTEAGLFAIRSDREYVTQEDFMKAVRKVADSKKLESKLDYKPV